jgi:hypothetical protein
MPNQPQTTDGIPGMPPPSRHPTDPVVFQDSAPLDQKQINAWNAKRQKDLAADTARLLQLANELKTEMDKSNKDTLSLSVVHKAEQIEKLAHSVQERMKASFTN